MNGKVNLQFLLACVGAMCLGGFPGVLLIEYIAKFFPFAIGIGGLFFLHIVFSMAGGFIGVCFSRNLTKTAVTTQDLFMLIPVSIFVAGIGFLILAIFTPGT